jgi:hypothetical protein
MLFSWTHVDFWTMLFFMDSCCFWTMLMPLLYRGYVAENDVQVLLKYGVKMLSKYSLIAAEMLLQI